MSKSDDVRQIRELQKQVGAGVGDWSAIPFSVRQIVMTLADKAINTSASALAASGSNTFPEEGGSFASANSFDLPRLSENYTGDGFTKLPPSRRRSPRGAISPSRTAFRPASSNQHADLLPGSSSPQHSASPQSQRRLVATAYGVPPCERLTVADRTGRRSTHIRDVAAVANALQRSAHLLSHTVAPHWVLAPEEVSHVAPLHGISHSGVSHHQVNSLSVPLSDEQMRLELDQRESLHKAAQAVSEAHEAVTNFMAEFFTKAEKRHLGGNTHKMQSKQERSSTYQYYQRKPPYAWSQPRKATAAEHYRDPLDDVSAPQQIVESHHQYQQRLSTGSTGSNHTGRAPAVLISPSQEEESFTGVTVDGVSSIDCDNSVPIPTTVISAAEKPAASAIKKTRTQPQQQHVRPKVVVRRTSPAPQAAVVHPKPSRKRSAASEETKAGPIQPKAKSTKPSSKTSAAKEEAGAKHAEELEETRKEVQPVSQRTVEQHENKNEAPPPEFAQFDDPNQAEHQPHGGDKESSEADTLDDHGEDDETAPLSTNQTDPFDEDTAEPPPQQPAKTVPLPAQAAVPVGMKLPPGTELVPVPGTNKLMLKKRSEGSPGVAGPAAAAATAKPQQEEAALASTPATSPAGGRNRKTLEEVMKAYKIESSDDDDA